MKLVSYLITALLTCCTCFSQVKLPEIFGDHMIIQRDKRIPVWGWSSPDENVTVRFHQQIKKTIADHNGIWKLTLEPESAGGPFELTVDGKNHIKFQDVLVGEVWLCSGQSNMEFELKFVREAGTEIQAANYPDIRQIKIAPAIAGKPKDDIQPSAWKACSAKTSPEFTAVGYFFARELVKRLHVPVGLINATWGGTMVETWISRGAFEKSREFKDMISSIPDKNFDSIITEKRNQLEQQIKINQKNITDSAPEFEWKNPDYNSQTWPKISVARAWENQSLGLGDLDGIVWYRKDCFLQAEDVEHPVILTLGTIDDEDETYVNGILVGSTHNWDEKRVYHLPLGILKPGKNTIAVRVNDTGGGGGFYGDSSAVGLRTEKGFLPLQDGWCFRIAKISEKGIGIGPNDFPSLLFNAMIHPLIPFGLRGVLWYQGEANADRAYQYRVAFPLLITDWRTHWGEINLPFYFVQLASYNAANGNSQHGSSWAELREAQTNTLALPYTGMAVTIDIGESNDIHPKNKQDVGSRLAAIALNQVYGQPNEFCGPGYTSMSVHENKVILGFTHCRNGLRVKDKYGYVKGFEIAGSDHQFHLASAYIQGNTVIAYSDKVKHPVSVRYAWADDAGDANLYNQEGFPAIPFRTDHWQGLTDNRKYAIGN